MRFLHRISLSGVGQDRIDERKFLVHSDAGNPTTLQERIDLRLDWVFEWPVCTE
jgi:hypothetical protein